MSSTESPRDFADLYTALINRVRENTGDTATVVVAKRSINEGLVDFHLGHDYKMRWAEVRANLYTHANYSTGTVTVTSNSATVTGASTAWQDTDNLGRDNVRAPGKIKFSGSSNIYRVQSVASSTSLTLADAYPGDTEAGVAYNYWEDEYQLPNDFLRPVSWHNFSDEINLELLPRDRFRQWTRNNRTTGTPRFASIFDVGYDDAIATDTTRYQYVALSPPPFKIIQIPYWYVTNQLAVTSSGVEAEMLVNDDDEPRVPYRYRQGIVLNALWQWYRDRRDDQRSQEAFQQYDQWLGRTLGDGDIGAKRPRVRPDIRMYRGRSRRPWSGGGRFDIAGRFDRLEDINR